MIGGGEDAAPRRAGSAPAYVDVSSPAGAWRTHPAFAAAIRTGEADFLFGPQFARRAADGSGRGTVARFALAGQPMVGKRALHGGWLGPWIGGLYLGRRRVLAQIETARRLRDGGVPTPDIVGVGTAAVVGPLRSHVVVSRELSGARNLLETSRAPLGAERRRVVLRQCADLLRSAHAAGFLHADLNVGNLVFESRDGRETLHVVDLDRARFVPAASFRDRARNLARLARSYEKWIAPGARLSARETALFLRRYAAGDRAEARRLFRSLRLRRSLARLLHLTRRRPEP